MKTKRTIRVTVTLVVEDFCEDRDAAQFWWEENHCIGNELAALGRKLDDDTANGVCNVCAHSSVELLSDGPGYDVTSVRP